MAWKETQDVMFADFINPEFTYEYANTTTENGNKKVTVVFDVADKYFDESTLSTDPTASKITVSIGGETATNATKKLTKLSDITETINGIEGKKVGEKYQLEITNIDEYSGVMTLAFPEGTVIDKSNNRSIAKTITVDEGIICKV